MKVKEIYNELYDKCDDIFASFILFIIDNYRSTIKDANTIDAYKKKYINYSSKSFREKYQCWYTNSLIVLSVLLPERKKEFIDLYVADPKRKELNVLTYKISDAISGLTNIYTRPSNSINQIQRQIDIIKSIKSIIDSKINDIRQLIENDVFENELDTSKYLLSKGFNRSAGAICGVLLEKHLKGMLVIRGLTISKKDPSINDLNAELYKNGIIDSTQNKYLLFLGDIRNKCDHDKKSEPTKDEINDLINGTSKVLKTFN